MALDRTVKTWGDLLNPIRIIVGNGLGAFEGGFGGFPQSYNWGEKP